MQFSLRTLLLAAAFTTITLGAYGVHLGFESFRSGDFWQFPLYMLTELWFWVPPLFIAFAVGRRRLTPWMLVVFLVCEGATFAVGPLLERLDAFGDYMAAPPAAPAPPATP